MNDDAYNPFAELDKSRFPAKRHAKRAIPKSPPPPPPPPPAEPIQDEEDLFLDAMNGVAPLKRSGRQVTPEGETDPTREPYDSDTETVKQLRELVDGKIEFQLEFSEEYIEGRVSGLDTRILAKLKTGRLSPEGHLDLHGQNAPQAYANLIQFMKDSYLAGRRCVLLIPGRGKNSPEGYGVLRDRVKTWLTQDPFKRVVLAFCTALARHGGAGALYVLLRQHKKTQGKILWDRTPMDDDLL